MSRAPELEIGDRVIDADADGTPSAAEVVEVTDETADNYHIDAINTTVAKANPGHPADSPVIGIRFVRGDEPGGPTYHYPAARLESISDEWEPPETKSDAQREREAAIERHERKFEAFAAAVRYLARAPEHSAEWFAKHYDPHTRPETRGDCVHSREDSYRPNTPGAICCWECNGGGRRPDKFHVDDPVPPHAPCRAEGSRDPTGTLYQWFHDKVAPAIPVEQDIDRVPNPTYTGLRWDAVALSNADSVSRKRAAVLRIAYEATIGGVLDEDYNHSRTCAYLRDLDVDTDAVLPGGDPYVGTGRGESR